MVTPAKTDVVVIGGGPAGLVAALAARRGGFEVCVVDRGVPPIDKACGEGLMPDGVVALRRLGVRLGAEHGVPFRGIRILDGRHAVEAAFPAEAGVGIRRTRLHQVLVESARDAGVTTAWRAKATAIEAKGVWIGERFIECRWIIGADGVDSPTRGWAGMEVKRESGRRLGLRLHYRVKPWTDFVEVHCSGDEQAYVTPVGAEEVCVALLGPAQEVSFAELAVRFPRLGERLMGAQPTSAARGAFTGMLRPRRVTSGNVALVGDASAAIDAITGDGLALAFRQAAALGEALRQGDLLRYEARHRQICRAPFLMARLLLLMARHEGPRKLALQTVVGRPAIFNRLLAVHVGARHPVAASLDVAALGVGVLTHAAMSRSRSAAP